MKRIESAQNPKVKQWRKLHTRKEREKSGTFLVEGYHLVEEALKNKQQVSEIILGENTNIPKNWDLDGVDLYLVTEDILKALAETETSQGVFAVYRHHEYKDEQQWKRVLLLDAVQDPGNLGTIIRTADAAGMDGVILGEGTVDAYNAKTLRSSQGSIFHIPVVRGNIRDWIENLKSQSIPVYGTALENALPFKEVESQDAFALMLGNEGKGVSSEHLAGTDQNLYIPIHGHAESLNVAIAAGILLYHLRG
ncbi:TrmH family RNA methyltransferase [Bacillus sp. SJS]|uniref:TrmH family RNA methyltransferase n=1 Tax=Bacillus sp. SJS TaxID=1423321 RepID=UPI0004DCE69D|nr:RNA methyltransferase [Bacillus sp. SJS]KZZ85921.1 RNA methyltransferase [Bacillus sp. SJS]